MAVPGGSKSGGSKRSEERKARKYAEEGVRMYQMGRNRFEPKLLLRAKELLAASVALHPSAASFFYLGNTLNLLARPKTATRAYLECLRLNPASSAAHQNVAQVFDDLGNRTAALAHYQHWVDLEPRSAKAKKGLALSYLWAHTDRLQDGSRLCDEAAELDVADPSIPFDCAQLLVLLLPPSQEATAQQDFCTRDSFEECGDPSSSHWMTHIEPKFRRAQEAAFRSWRGGPVALPFNSKDAVTWADSPTRCTQGVAVRDPLQVAEIQAVHELSTGGSVYGQRIPVTFGGPFSWAGQRYIERSVRLSTLTDVMISGNEGVVTKGCQILVPYYDKQVPWHENLPHPAHPKEEVKWLPVALWLLVMFPANFFSFLVDELARLAVWLTVSKQRVPLLARLLTGHGTAETFQLSKLQGACRSGVRPHFMGPERVAEPRFLVRELHMVDWHDAPESAKREDVFLLPPRWALQNLRRLAVGQALGFQETGNQEEGSPRSRNHTLLWIQRATATTRRVANEEALLHAMMAEMGSGWQLKVFSDIPPAPTAHEALHLFRSADLVVGLYHGSEIQRAYYQVFLEVLPAGKDLSNKQVDDFMNEFDADKSGTIGLNELHAFLRFYDSSSKTMRRKTALLVIDVQNDFISGTLAVQTSEGIVPTINQMRDQFDCVVISYDWHPHEHCSFVESANAGKVAMKETESVGKLKAFTQVTLLGDADRAEHPQMLYPRHAVQNTWGGECHKDLVVKPEDMSVYKGKKANIDSYSAFFDNCKANDTGLTKQLEDAGVTDVYCCGLVFDICVKSSALHGAEMGFRVSVIEDACKPLSESEVLPTKKVLNEAGVRVLTSAQAVAEVKQIKAAGNMALGDFIQQVAHHKNAAMLHKVEALSSHCLRG
ncbi:unnamed protein product [Cladocopium goreaui]|uniref:nicotinamidase n=1 Tax=Cladocopium goreaui TaxID=2562237 RepID=A0A9P1FPV4_9DINO|nr:unnamed protein product [Cladocopium goreaui]